MLLLHLAPERAVLSDPLLSSSWFSKHHVAVSTQHDGLRVAVDSGDLQAARALDIHEKAVGRLNHALELVLGLLLLEVWVKQINVHCYKDKTKRLRAGLFLLRATKL